MHSGAGTPRANEIVSTPAVSQRRRPRADTFPRAGLPDDRGPGGRHLAAVARARPRLRGARSRGLFRSDHYRGGLRGDGGSLDAWATLAGLAAVTSRLRLGTMVSPVTFRPPGVLAKNVVTVDHISSGRVELGIGAGWNESEHDQHGLPFPPAHERVALLAEQVETIVRHWTDDENVHPKPVQRPRPPLIVGGTAHPGTLGPAVRFADEYNTFAAGLDDLRERRSATRRGVRARRPRPRARSGSR